ncbi:MAG TPA: YIP1 family protein [Pyrinomonadaceae bacterium]|jgi:hypothetical protein
MNRLAGIVIAVLGLIITVLSIAKVLPGYVQTGIVLCLLGILIIGLSFISKPKAEGDGESRKMSTPSTLVNIFFSPTEVFQNLRRHPRWLAALLIMTVLSAVYTNLFLYRLTPERVTNYTIDKTLETSWVANNEDAKKSVEAGRAEAIQQNKDPLRRAVQAVSGFTASLYWYAFLSAILFLFAMALGGKINYWQAFSAAIYAAFPITVIWFVLSTIILFIKDPTDVHPILGQTALVQDNLSFLTSPGAHPVLYTLLSVFGVLSFLRLWLTATGLKNAGEQISSPTAWTITLVLFVFGILLGVLFASVFGGFMG